MASQKIIYGIDLGTTNSAITRFENGKAVVKKNGMQSDTTPSCVAFNRTGKTIVGARARAQLGKDYALAFKNSNYKFNTFIEFKRLMGTDHIYEVPNFGKSVAPEFLSAEVLKELKKCILDDDVVTAVITVPAMFNNTQKDATKRAARMAGFEHVELIQEPVAASIAFGLDSKMKDAYWVVFDFGGGTFDAALMKIEGGIMQAIDTAGNNKLGGKDIDRAIIDNIILPYIKENYSIDNILANKAKSFSDMWKAKAEEAKIQLSFNDSYDLETDLGEDYGVDDNGEEIALSLTITRQMLEDISTPIYQKAVDLTKELLRRNNISGDSLGALILVGGPTHAPLIRRMLREQITPNVDTSIDPMTCVAAGASIYGMTLDVPEEVADATRDRSKVQLAINYQSTSVEEEEWVSVSLLKDKCDNYDADAVQIEFVRKDGMFTSPMCTVDTVGDVVALPLKTDATNVFDVRCYDERGTRLECEPDQISIIQGIAGLDSAVIPMALGLGTMNSDGVEVFDPIEGLEKSRKLPANGEIRGLKVPKDIRPGVLEDSIRLTLYQVEEVLPGTRALYCQRVYDVFLTGDDIPAVLHAGSEILVKLHAERSGTIDKFEVELPSLGMTVDLTDRVTNSKTSAPTESAINGIIYDARKRVRELAQEPLKNRLDIIEQRFHNSDTSDRDAAEGIINELQALCRDIDREYAVGAWERQQRRLQSMYDELCADNQKYGNASTTQLIEQLRQEKEQVEARQDVELAKDLYSKMWNLDYRIAEVEFYIVWIRQWNQQFNQKSWTNRARARELVDRGMQMLSGAPTADQLRPIAFEIRELLPASEKPADDVVRH